MGFLDRSSQFSTSVIYLLSYDCTGNKYNISLVSTLSKLADKPKLAKLTSQGDLERLEKCQQYDTVPKLEAHGLVFYLYFVLRHIHISQVSHESRKGQLPVTRRV